MATSAKVIELKGDPKNPESAEHIIKFPGGSISICRTSKNEYWAHIEINRHQIIADTIRESKLGEIIENRLDYDEWGMRKIKDIHDLEHVAIKIATKG